jgi:hypothetical protein
MIGCVSRFGQVISHAILALALCSLTACGDPSATSDPLDAADAAPDSEPDLSVSRDADAAPRDSVVDSYTPFDAEGAPLDPAACPPPPAEALPPGLDLAYVPMRSGDPYSDRLFYLLTVLMQDAEARAAVTAREELTSLAATRRARALSAADTCADGMDCLLAALRWEQEEGRAAGEALAAALSETLVVARHLRASGAFAQHAGLDDAALIEAAWADTSAGLDRLLDDYAAALGVAWLSGAIHEAYTPDAPFFAPGLALTGRAMDALGRDEPVRYEPLHEGENAAAMARAETVDWDAAPFALILVPGIGPGDLDTPITGMSMAHADQGAARWRAGLAPFIVPSGGHVHPFGTPYCEALEMKRYLMETHDVPEDAILIDPYARHTPPNLRNAARLALRAGVPLKKPLLLTTDVLQHIAVTTLGPRCEDELGYSCWAALSELTPRDNCWYLNPLSLHQDARDPLDP